MGWYCHAGLSIALSGMIMKAKTVLIAGAGGVLSQAVAKEFSQAGYTVIGIRRKKSKESLEQSTVYSQMHFCELHDRHAIQQVVDRILVECGSIDVLVHNAAHLVMAPFLEMNDADFQESWRAALGSAVACAQAVLPSMLGHQAGAMIFSGATASLRGASQFAAFAAAKFGLRGLAQSLAREYQSQGVHVAHVVIDGLLRGSLSVPRFGGREENTIDPGLVAGTYRWLAEQPSSAWTLELDVRPSRSERF